MKTKRINRIKIKTKKLKGGASNEYLKTLFRDAYEQYVAFCNDQKFRPLITMKKRPVDEHYYIGTNQDPWSTHPHVHIYESGAGFPEGKRTTLPATESPENIKKTLKSWVEKIDYVPSNIKKHFQILFMITEYLMVGPGAPLLTRKKSSDEIVKERFDALMTLPENEGVRGSKQMVIEKVNHLLTNLLSKEELDFSLTATSLYDSFDFTPCNCSKTLFPHDKEVDDQLHRELENWNRLYKTIESLNKLYVKSNALKTLLLEIPHGDASMIQELSSFSHEPNTAIETDMINLLLKDPPTLLRSGPGQDLEVISTYLKKMPLGYLIMRTSTYMLDLQSLLNKYYTITNAFLLNVDESNLNRLLECELLLDHVTTREHCSLNELKRLKELTDSLRDFPRFDIHHVLYASIIGNDEEQEIQEEISFDKIIQFLDKKKYNDFQSFICKKTDAIPDVFLCSMIQGRVNLVISKCKDELLYHQWTQCSHITRDDSFVFNIPEIPLLSMPHVVYTIPSGASKSTFDEIPNFDDSQRYKFEIPDTPLYVSAEHLEKYQYEGYKYFKLTNPRIEIIKGVQLMGNFKSHGNNFLIIKVPLSFHIKHESIGFNTLRETEETPNAPRTVLPEYLASKARAVELKESNAKYEETRQQQTRKKLEDDARVAEETRKKLEDDARVAEETRQKLEQEARKKLEDDARVAEETRKKLEQEARKKLEHDARVAEETRQKLEQKARKKLEYDAKVAEKAQQKIEHDARVAEETRQKIEHDARVAEETRQKLEQEARQKYTENHPCTKYSVALGNNLEKTSFGKQDDTIIIYLTSFLNISEKITYFDFYSGLGLSPEQIYSSFDNAQINGITKLRINDLEINVFKMFEKTYIKANKNTTEYTYFKYIIDEFHPFVYIDKIQQLRKLHFPFYDPPQKPPLQVPTNLIAFFDNEKNIIILPPYFTYVQHLRLDPKYTEFKSPYEFYEKFLKLKKMDILKSQSYSQKICGITYNNKICFVPLFDDTAIQLNIYTGAHSYSKTDEINYTSYMINDFTHLLEPSTINEYKCYVCKNTEYIFVPNKEEHSLIDISNCYEESHYNIYVNMGIDPQEIFLLQKKANSEKSFKYKNIWFFKLFQNVCAKMNQLNGTISYFLLDNTPLTYDDDTNLVYTKELYRKLSIEKLTIITELRKNYRVTFSNEDNYARFQPVRLIHDEKTVDIIEFYKKFKVSQQNILSNLFIASTTKSIVKCKNEDGFYVYFFPFFDNTLECNITNGTITRYLTDDGNSLKLDPETKTLVDQHEMEDLPDDLPYSLDDLSGPGASSGLEVGPDDSSRPDSSSVSEDLSGPGASSGLEVGPDDSSGQEDLSLPELWPRKGTKTVWGPPSMEEVDGGKKYTRRPKINKKTKKLNVKKLNLKSETKKKYTKRYKLNVKN